MVGAAVCLRQGFHLQVNLLQDALAPRAQYVLIFVQNVIVALFGLFAVRYVFVMFGWGQTSPSSCFLVAYARMVMPIGGALIILQVVALGGRCAIWPNTAATRPTRRLVVSGRMAEGAPLRRHHRPVCDRSHGGAAPRKTGAPAPSPASPPGQGRRLGYLCKVGTVDFLHHKDIQQPGSASTVRKTRIAVACSICGHAGISASSTAR